MEFFAVPEKEVLEKLNASVGGLSASDAASRLKVYGHNVLREEEQVHPFIIFLQQFKSPLVWILIVAMGISLLVRELVDFYVIAVIVVLNAVLGFFQEYRAERSIDALKKMISLKATVLRDGEEVIVDASEVVPGDILLLATGDKVSADARIIESVNLQIQEAALTGESVPVKKTAGVLHAETAVADRSNMVFSGTIVTNGRAKAVVIGTGMQTEFGKIARLIQEAKPEPTPLQKKLKRIGLFLGSTVIIVAVAVFLIELALFDEPWSALLLTAMALAVAAIPEGLPAVVTVGLSLGVQRLAKKNALMRTLPSVETLGACSVICTDKTGTLTHNEMTVRRLFVNKEIVEVAGSGYDSEGHFSHDVKSFELLLRIGALNNDAKLNKENGVWQVIGDPTEAALIVSARKAGLNVEELSAKNPRIGEKEFTSERKRMTTIHKIGKDRVSYVKGAPEVIVSRCSKMLVNGRVVRLSTADKKEILAKNDEFAKSALRVLAFAYKAVDSKDPEDDLTFVGLQAMLDPPRKEAKEAIAKCETAGIKVVMITGDHIVTAEAVAKELGILGRAVTGVELDKIHNLADEVETIAIYARVNPAHKLKIIEAFKAKGHIVAMTGDGVNDAPALKKADLGIAMGISGTAVAKEASAMILADDNFASIVRAVEEGRRIYDNIQKYLAYLLGGNIGEVLTIVSSMVIGLPLPLVALQILWVNLVTDGLPALALGVDPAEPDVMRRPPRKPEQSVFKGLEPYVYVFPVILAVCTVWLFDRYLDAGLLKAQTMAFSSLVMFEVFAALSCRSLTQPVFMIGIFKNKMLWLALVGSVALQFVLMYSPLSSAFGVVPLSVMEWLTVAGVAFIGFAYLEVHKLLIRK